MFDAKRFRFFNCFVNVLKKAIHEKVVTYFYFKISYTKYHKFKNIGNALKKIRYSCRIFKI